MQYIFLLFEVSAWFQGGLVLAFPADARQTPFALRAPPMVLLSMTHLMCSPCAPKASDQLFYSTYRFHTFWLLRQRILGSVAYIFPETTFQSVLMRLVPCGSLDAGNSQAVVAMVEGNN